MIPFFTTKGEFAAPGSPLQEVRGSGLGLAVSRTIAEAHNGEIAVQSAPGVGSVFTLWLPVIATGATGASGAGGPGGAGDTAKRARPPARG